VTKHAPGDVWAYKTMICYALMQLDIDEAWRIAHGRNDRKEAKSVHSRKIDHKKSELAPHYEGAIGEIGVGRVFNAEVDAGFWDHGDTGNPDLWLRYHVSAQVKLRTRRDYEFALNTTDPRELKADIGILVVPAVDGAFYNPGDVLILRGWTDRLQLILRGDDISFGFGFRRRIKRMEMNPIYAGDNLLTRIFWRRYAIYPKLKMPIKIIQ